uniref:Putative ovule protein n=1 Tax=Solanum chacoense TaxID=4108 RepID=A0A0V0H9H0_SOLCH
MGGKLGLHVHLISTFHVVSKDGMNFHEKINRHVEKMQQWIKKNITVVASKKFKILMSVKKFGVDNGARGRLI